MNWDRIAGNWKQAKGKFKEQWGKLTDDDSPVAWLSSRFGRSRREDIAAENKHQPQA